MKKVLTILLAGVTTLAMAQKRSSISRSIDDDGKTMRIRVTGDIDGRKIDCDKTVHVENLSDTERAALRDQVLESIGLGEMAVPEPPAAPQPPVPPAFVMADLSGSEIVDGVEDEEMEDGGMEEGEGEDGEMEEGEGEEDEDVDSDDTAAACEQTEFAKVVKYNPETGEMFLRYRFVKHGEEFIYEKTADVLEKSDSERARIIHDFETEIELPGRGI